MKLKLEADPGEILERCINSAMNVASMHKHHVTLRFNGVDIDIPYPFNLIGDKKQECVVKLVKVYEQALKNNHLT